MELTAMKSSFPVNTKAENCGDEVEIKEITGFNAVLAKTTVGLLRSNTVFFPQEKWISEQERKWKIIH